MGSLHRFLAASASLTLDPLLALGPLAALAIVSAVSGVVLLVAFRFTSRPAAIRAAKRRIQAHLLAVRIFRDDLGVVFRAQANVFRSLGAYLGNMLIPFAAILLPFALLFAHLDARWSSRALHPGETAIVKALVEPDTLPGWTLEAPEGVVIDSPPVRIPVRGEIVWRVRATSPGHHSLSIVGPAGRVEKAVAVATEDRAAIRGRAAPGLSSLFLTPAEPPIDPATAVRSIEVGYPSLPLAVFGWQVHWIVVFLVVSAAMALALRKRAGVEF